MINLAFFYSITTLIGQRRWYGMDQALVETGKQTATVKHGEPVVMPSLAWLPLSKMATYFSSCHVAATALLSYCALRTATLLSKPKTCVRPKFALSHTTNCMYVHLHVFQIKILTIYFLCINCCVTAISISKDIRSSSLHQTSLSFTTNILSLQKICNLETFRLNSLFYIFLEKCTLLYFRT